MMISEIMEENSLPTASQLVSLNKGEAPLDKDKDLDMDPDTDPVHRKKYIQRM